MAKRVSLKGRGADLFFEGYTPDQSPADSLDQPAVQPLPTPLDAERRARVAKARPPRTEHPVPPTRTDQSSTPSTSRSTDQSVDSSIDQLTDRSINPSPSIPFDRSPVLGKPKGFYITEQQDQDLNAAVTKLAAAMKGRSVQKIDRSTVVRLLLEDSGITTDDTINRLAARLVNRLVNQLTA
jgi:hypothetical protein